MKENTSFKPAVFLSVAICFMFFMFSPVEMYLTNKNEFWYDIYVLAPIMACVFLIFTVICILGFFVLYKWNDKLYRVALFILFITFICSYVQGNYLIKYLPVINGTTIDWNEHSKGRIESIVLWIVVTAVIVFLVKKLREKQMYTLIQAVSICMVLMFVVTLGTLCVANQGLEGKSNVSITMEHELTMSNDQNFIILLLDAVDGDAFSDMIVGNEEYESIFKDFTYYDNTTCAYTYTKYNIPFILSGIWFENETGCDTYFDDVLCNSPFFDELERRGFLLGMYDSEFEGNENLYGRFENVGLFTKKVSSYTTFARWQILLTGMKYAPFDLKRFSFVNPNAFEQLKVTEGDSKVFINDNLQFYDLLTAEDITFRDDKGFKFIHIWGAHPPYEQDKDLNPIENGTFTDSFEASISLADIYLEKLKESGVYDNSVIIILADHGNSDYNGNIYQDHPILLIKGLDEEHDFRVDDRPVCFEDLQAAYEKLLDEVEGGGQTVFNGLPQTRKRRYIYYHPAKTEYLVEYEQTGKAGDMSTMIPTGKEFGAQSE